MPRTASTSNPTKLIEIDRKRVTIDVTRDGSERFAALSRLDLSGYDIAPDLKLVMVARVRTTFHRIELGTAGAWNHSPQRLVGLDSDGVLRFRLLLHRADDPLLVASAENLVSRDVEQADSFFVMEPAALGEVAWEISWSSGEPVLLFNQELFPNARGAVGYVPFAAMVLPEVVRQVATKIAADPERLSDDTDALHPWKGFLDGLGADSPPDVDADEPEKLEWVSAVVNLFSIRNRLGSDLRRLLNNAD